MPLEPDALLLLERAVSQLRLPVRAYARTLSTARTIADLDPKPDVFLAPHQVAEALGLLGLH